MSLIIEALKKARDDAVRRQAAARGLPLAPVPRLESRSRWLTLALIPLVAALVICVMLLIDVYSRIPDTSGLEQTAPRNQSATQVTGKSSGLQVSLSTNDTAAGSDVEAASTASVPSSGPTERSDSQSPPVPVPEKTVPAAADTAESVPPTTQTSRDHSIESSSSPGGTRDATVSIGQVQLPGGHILDLGGIAWSESEPYALINGQVIGVGELVRSYRVTSITPDEVVLEKDEDRVILRLE